MASLSIDTGTPSRRVSSRAKGHVAVAEDRALSAYARRALDDPRQPDADAENLGHFKVGVLDTAPHAVLDEVGDDGRRLPVDADRQRERVEDIGAEIGDGDRDLVGRKAHADHIGRIRIELQHDARAPAARVTHGPDLQRSDQPVVEKSGGDSGNRGGAELGDLADLDAGHRPMAANRVHHVEAVDRAHEFWVGGLHRTRFRTPLIVAWRSIQSASPSRTRQRLAGEATFCLTASPTRGEN